MTIKQKYGWKRFLSPPDGQINLSGGGFLQDSTDPVGRYVNPDLIALDARNETRCLTLLREPGIGKSVEIENTHKD